MPARKLSVATQVYVHHRRNTGSVTRRSEHTNRAPSDGPNWLQVVGYFRSSRRIS